MYRKCTWLLLRVICVQYQVHCPMLYTVLCYEENMADAGVFGGELLYRKIHSTGPALICYFRKIREGEGGGRCLWTRVVEVNRASQQNHANSNFSTLLMKQAVEFWPRSSTSSLFTSVVGYVAGSLSPPPAHRLQYPSTHPNPGLA